MAEKISVVLYPPDIVPCVPLQHDWGKFRDPSVRNELIRPLLNHPEKLRGRRSGKSITKPLKQKTTTNWDVEMLSHIEAAEAASYSQVADMMMDGPSHDSAGIVRRTGMRLNRNGLLRTASNGKYEVTEEGHGFLLSSPRFIKTNFTKAVQLPGGVVRLFNDDASVTLNSQGGRERINSIIGHSAPIPMLSPTATVVSLATSRLKDAVNKRIGIFASTP